jgi:hypothetical protein
MERTLSSRIFSAIVHSAKLSADPILRASIELPEHNTHLVYAKIRVLNIDTGIGVTWDRGSTKIVLVTDGGSAQRDWPADSRAPMLE